MNIMCSVVDVASSRMNVVNVDLIAVQIQTQHSKLT